MNETSLQQSINSQQEVVTLYTLLGKAVWSIQHLEDALNTAIAIKNPESKNREEGDEIRDSNRELPLGRSIGLAEQQETFDEDLQKRLKSFLTERNWLIHRCMHESVDDYGSMLNTDKLFTKISDIERTAISLKEAIEIDMLKFCSANGRDDIRKSVAQSYANWLKAHSSK